MFAGACHTSDVDVQLLGTNGPMDWVPDEVPDEPDNVRDPAVKPVPVRVALVPRGDRGADRFNVSGAGVGVGVGLTRSRQPLLEPLLVMLVTNGSWIASLLQVENFAAASRRWRGS
jgi:hypothetical protein